MRSCHRKNQSKSSVVYPSRHKAPVCRKSVQLTVVLFVVLILVISITPYSTVYAAEKKPSTYIKNATAHLTINRDGTVSVTEELRFYFNKTRKSLSLSLLFPLRGESVLQSFEIAQVIQGEEEKFIHVPETDDRRPQPFSYKTERRNDRLRIKLTMTAFTGEYVFRLNYHWTRGVVEKDNRAFISGPLCAAPSGMRVETLLWSITFPTDCHVDLTEIVPISYHTMTENNTGSNKVSFVDNRSFTKTDEMGIVISAPKRHFSLILPSDADTTSLKESLENARALSAHLTRVESIRESITRIVVILTVAGLFVFLVFQGALLHRKRRTKFDFAVWPVSARPALVASLASANPREPDLLLATLLTLVTRREILWTDEVFIWNNPDRNDFSQFTTYETLLLQWLFVAQPEYDHVLSPGRLRIAARQEDFRQLAQRFKEHVSADFNKSGLVEPRLTRIIKSSAFLLAILFIALTIGFYLYTKSFLTFIMLIVSALYIHLGFTFRFLTSVGARRSHETRRFKRALKSPELLVRSALGHFSDIEMLIGSLPVAVALNKASEYLQGVKELDSPLFERAAYALLHVYRGLRVPAHLETSGDIRDPYERTLLRRALDETERVLTSWRELFRSCFL
ncbi:MAG TPA: DUF2207 domain-containing protein [Clostridiaceae bacterium]|nr:DUF2207 domain-containing protein [Clostridiaceae bacterium]